MPPIDGIGACALTNSEKNGVASVAVTSVYLASARRPANPPALHEELVLVAETVGLPLGDPVHGDAHRIALAVEDDVTLHGDAFVVVVDRHRLEAELVLPADLPGDPQVANLVILQQQVPLEVDAGARDAERLAGNHHVGGGAPETGEALDAEALTGRRLVDRLRLELGERRRGGRQQQGEYHGTGGRRNLHDRANVPLERSESAARRRRRRATSLLGRQAQDNTKNAKG